MIKRTFVLFFCLAQMLAISLLTEQAGIASPIVNGNDSFNPRYTSPSDCTQDFDYCRDVCDSNIPIIRSNDFEWKESITDLLRHRHSTYRFVSLTSVSSSFLQFITNFKDLLPSLKSFFLATSEIILPGYYGFLHRLCPF